MANIPTRECLDCTMCCELLEIPELKKPADTLCKLAFEHGCSAYRTRPRVCSNFACIWLHGLMHYDMKPNRTGGRVYQAIYDSNDMVCLGLNEREPVWIFVEKVQGAAILFCTRMIVNLCKRGEKAIISYHGEKALFGPDTHFQVSF